MEYIIAILIFIAAPFLNREIGDGDEGLIKSRAVVFVIWAALVGLLGWVTSGDWLIALSSTLWAGICYPVFRQPSPRPALLAGNGTVNGGKYKTSTNALTEYFAVKLFDMPDSFINEQYLDYNGNKQWRNNEEVVIYGIKVGGLRGFLYAFLGWGVLGTLFISTWSILFTLPAMGYGYLHYYLGQVRDIPDFRKPAEMITGALIIAPCSIFPALLFDRGLLWIG